MNAGLIRRSIAFFTDFIFIAALISFTFTLVAAPIYRSTVDDFDIHYEAFQVLQEDRSEQLRDLNTEEYELRDQYEDGEITESEFNTELDRIRDERDAINEHYTEENYPQAYGVGNRYLFFSIVYGVFGFAAFHIAYMLLTKGHSIGRKLMRLRLAGNINILSLLLREFFWKYFYFVMTLGFGIIIDLYMIVLRTDKKTLRDHFSKTRVIVEDIKYPF